MIGNKKECVKWLIDAPEDKQYEVKEYHKRRSTDANALLWHCLGQLAVVMRTDKWQVYLLMLKRYGKYTYILVPPKAVEATQKMWRESEVLNTVNVNGRESVQMLCYYGSHLYDSKEFSVLLDGVISEMEEVGLAPPPSSEMRRAIERMEREEQKNKGAGDTADGEEKGI